MTRSNATYAFECPDPDCDFAALIDYIAPTRVDPGYLNGDPPEDCPKCGADMTEIDAEMADLADYYDGPDQLDYFER